MIRKLTIIPLILASIIIFVLSIISLSKPKIEYKETVGTIKHIEEVYDYDLEDYTHNVYINYEADNKKYVDILYPSYDSSMKENDEVKVYYDPNDPKTIQAEGYKIVPYITLGASVIVLALSIKRMIKN